MALTAELLEMMWCPACRGDLELKADRSALKCVQCRRVYPIRDEVPVMLVDEAKVE